VTEEELGRVVDIVVRALEQRFEQRLERWTRAVEEQMQRRLDAIRADIDTALLEDEAPEDELEDELDDEEPDEDELDDDELDETAFEDQQPRAEGG